MLSDITCRKKCAKDFCSVLYIHYIMKSLKVSPASDKCNYMNIATESIQKLF